MSNKKFGGISKPSTLSDTELDGGGGVCMYRYIVFLLQMMLWSGYTVAEWISRRDHIEYKWLMFIIVLYLALVIGKRFIHSKQEITIITIVSLSSFYICRYLFEWLFINL